MARLEDIAEDRLSAEQRRIYDAIAAGRGHVGGPLRVWLKSPPLADRAQALGAFCRYDSSLPPRLSEFAILIMGAYWKAAYEWNAHVPHALKAGVAPRTIEALRTGQPPDGLDAEETAVYAFTRELLANRTVTERTFKSARDTLGEIGVIDLVGVLGYYTLISMTCVAFEVEPDGPANPFA